MTRTIAPTPMVPGPPTAQRPGKGPPGTPKRIGYLYYLYLLPAVLLNIAFVSIPIVQTFWLSLHDWDGLSEPQWIGLANYAAVFEDEVIQRAFLNAVIFIVFYCVLPVSLGLVLAATFLRLTRGIAVYRTILFLPQVISTVVIAVTWRWLYGPDGPINQALHAVGLGFAARPWLGDFDFALPAVGLIGTWSIYGFMMILFIAGVQKIPTDLFDAARVDGAGRVREFFVVTLPNLRHETAVALVLSATAAFQNFDIVFVTTRGGPAHTTTVPSIEVYQGAFIEGRVGVAATVAVLLSAAVLLITFVILSRSRDD